MTAPRKFLVTGSHGQLGQALLAAVALRGEAGIGVDVDTLDLTDAPATSATVRGVRPDVIVNCAAFTAVDAAETAEAQALAVNGTAVGTLAAAANEVGAALVQISTDYVFDGSSPRPYREDDPVCPVSAYGRTKLAGERAAAEARRALVVRTAWLFGRGHNFIEAIRSQLAHGSTLLRVVDDQRGSPTYATDLAEAILDLVAVEAVGIVHAVNDASTTWFGLAQEIVRQTGAKAEVVAISTDAAARPARRPANSVLATDRLAALLGRRLPPWPDALARYLDATGDHP